MQRFVAKIRATFLVAGALALALCLPAPTALAGAGKRVALVIGNGG